MRRFVCALVALLAIGVSLSATEEISWRTNFARAKRDAEREGKPMVLFFTGSDWCGWCKKLDREVFADESFVDRAGEKFVFMKVDFPMHSDLSEGMRSQNERLKAQYNIDGYPTIIILDENQQKVIEAGYQPGGGNKYADFLLKILHNYSAYQERLKDVGIKRIASTDLEQLYHSAQQLGQNDDINLIIQAGLASDNPTPFLLEQYRMLVEGGMRRSEEAQMIRKHLLDSDPVNTMGVHYRLAIVEFQHRAEALAKGNGTVDEACAPLVAYIERFGATDVENLWRLNMTVAQTHMSRGDTEKALKFAKASHRAAPQEIRSDIAETIQVLQMSKHRGETVMLK